MKSEQVNRLRRSLVVTRDYLVTRDETSWAEHMATALDMIDRDDFSFLDDLYSIVAPTCEIEDLFITEPGKQHPPLTEDEANAANNQLADIINELSASLEPFWDRKHND